MKNLLILFIALTSLKASAQNLSTEPLPLDKSPMDMSYYPANYPVLKIQDKATEPLVMRLIYSRPQLNGRKIFGDLQEYGSVWRLGANEATEIDFFKDVKINGKKIKSGRYTLYAIPFADKWTMIVNKETDTWGSFRYDASKDVLRVSVPVTKIVTIEAMTIVFDKSQTGADMNMYWDNVKVSLPIAF